MCSLGGVFLASNAERSGLGRQTTQAWVLALVLNLPDKERGTIGRKAADYMLLTESLTRRAGCRTPSAVIDTNALLDWLVFQDRSALAFGAAISAGRLLWLATPPLLDELRLVLARPFADRWEAARKHALTTPITPLFKMCEPPGPARPALLCRDASDQMFIDLALANAPCWLITRDRALLALRRRAAAVGVSVGTPTQWQQQSSAAPGP